MASNPNLSRRPAVDASIVQADTVRGYDAPQASEQACDLIISNGQNEVTGDVSDLILTNRTDDQEQPVMLLVPGADLSIAPRFGIHAGALADPNGAVTGPIGSLYVSNNPAALWQNSDGGSTWVEISDDLGGEDLAETLLIGNTSGPTDIIMSKTPGGSFTAARVKGEDTSDGTVAGDLLLYAGASTGASGNGGGVLITSGESVNANSGDVILSSGPATASAASSGAMLISTGNSADGPSGSLAIGTGFADDDSGDILFATGGSTNGSGGDIVFTAFGGPTGGGAIDIIAGSATPGGNIVGANVTVSAGQGSGTAFGGSMFLNAGDGGPSGGPGGNIILSPGASTNPLGEGFVFSTGLFYALNMGRFGADPNTLGLPSSEGYVYQDSTAGDGALWVNTNGATTGWRKLAFAADFVSSFTRMSYGTITPSSEAIFVDPLSDFGLLQGADLTINGTATNSRTSDEYGPVIDFNTLTPGDYIGWEVPASTTSTLQGRHRYLAVVKFAATSEVSSHRMCFGLTNNDLATHMGSNLPAGEYILIQTPAPGNAWEMTTQGPGGSLTQSLGSLTSVGLNVPRYGVFDLTVPNVIRCQILDEEFNLISEQTVEAPDLNRAPSDTTGLHMIFGASQTGATALEIKFYTANVVVEADQILSASGLNSNPTLEQVLMAGNQTGANDIVISDASSAILTSDSASGLPLVLRSGIPTTMAGSSGSVSLTSGAITDGTNTGTSGDVVVSTGNNDGNDAGQLVLRAGVGANSAGGILMQVGDGTPTTGATAGNIQIFGQSVDGLGDTGGNVVISSGAFSSNQDGNSGGITLSTGLNAGPGKVGDLRLQTAGTFTGEGGNVIILSGSSNGTAGNVSITAGFSTSTDGGELSMRAGNGANATGGAVTLDSGDGQTGGDVTIKVGDSSNADGAKMTLQGSSSATGNGGDIELIPGTGVGTDGEVLISGDLSITGKLNVAGLIDPTGLVLNAQGGPPYAPPVGEGLIWVDSTSDELFFTNSMGTVNLSAGGGGGGGSLATLSDVSLGVLTPGDNLQWNGVFWTNVPGAAAGSLAAALLIGNETGSTPIILTDDPAVGIFGQDSAGPTAGPVSIRGGNATGVSGQGGNVQVFGGEGAGTVDGGNVNVQGGAGGAGGAAGGDIALRGGVSTGALKGGLAELRGGVGGAGGGDGGDVAIIPGVGQGGGVAGIVDIQGNTNITGDLDISGKLTVAGLIDPTGLVLTSQGGAPVVPAGNDGLIWVDAGGNFIITSTAGTVNINSIAAGAGDLQTVLSLGNTTGATDLELSTGAVFLFNQNVSTPGGLPGAGNGKLWMDAADQLVYSTSGGDTVLTGGGASPSLSQVLTTGNTSGANDIVLNNDQSLRGQLGGFFAIRGGNNTGAVTAAPYPGYDIANALSGGVYLLGGSPNSDAEDSAPIEIATSNALALNSASAGANAGNVRISGGIGADNMGSGSGGNGSRIELLAGAGGPSSFGDGGVGGSQTITAGAGGTSGATNGGDGGGIAIDGGNGGDTTSVGSSSGSGGNIDILAGDAGVNPAGPEGIGGAVNIAGGDSDKSFGGAVNIRAGASTGSAFPGAGALLRGGNSLNGIGGSVTIEGGTSIGAQGGTIYITPGVGATRGGVRIGETDAPITLRGELDNANSTLIKRGQANFAGGGTVLVIPFPGSPMDSSSPIVTVTPVVTGGLAPSEVVSVQSVSATQVVLERSAGTVANLVVNWIAMA